MKKWNNPELLSLGVENTFEGACDCGAALYGDDTSTDYSIKNMHFCHNFSETGGTWHRNNCTSIKDENHVQSGSRCPSGGSHEWAGQSHNSNCCCPPTAISTPPGLS